MLTVYDCQSYGIGRIDAIDEKAKELDGTELIKYLTNANDVTAGVITRRPRN